MWLVIVHKRKVPPWSISELCPQEELVGGSLGLLVSYIPVHFNLSLGSSGVPVQYNVFFTWVQLWPLPSDAPSLMKDILAHGRVVGTRWSLKFPSKPNYSMILCSL